MEQGSPGLGEMNQYGFSISGILEKQSSHACKLPVSSLRSKLQILAVH